MKISVICVYNRKRDYEEQLAKSLQVQDVSYEMIAIDNTKNTYPSAAAALNVGAGKATGNILIFSHQDIYFKTKDGLRKLSQAIEALEVGTIVGIQGVRDKSKEYFSNLTAGESLDTNLNYAYEEECIPVSNVDEGLFGMKRQTWENHSFNVELCDNWHLYCVESCLWARKNGYGVYVYPIQVHHFSYGTITKDYMKNLIRLADEYRKDFRYLWTTCYKVSTSRIYIRGLYMVWVLNRKMQERKHK